MTDVKSFQHITCDNGEVTNEDKSTLVKTKYKKKRKKTSAQE